MLFFVRPQILTKNQFFKNLFHIFFKNENSPKKLLQKQEINKKKS